MNKPIVFGICVPTIREENIKSFLLHWKILKDSSYKIIFFIHEDKPKKSIKFLDDYPIEVVHTSQEDIERHLKKDFWIIPKKSDASRSFPMYLAWKIGCDYIITLDDDCYPIDEEKGKDFLRDHLKAFSQDRWFNTIENEIPRGIPYENKGHLSVLINHGLWRGTADLDGPTSLQHFRKKIAIQLRSSIEIIPPDVYFPLCAMNVCYHRDAIVAAYNLLMGFETFAFDRFDDIWSGIILKRIADHLGFYITNSLPFILHKKASNPFVNTRKESLGIHLNEFFWQHIDAAPLKDEKNISECYVTLAKWIKVFLKHYPQAPSVDSYFEKLSEAMIIWTKLFENDYRDSINELVLETNHIHC